MMQLRHAEVRTPPRIQRAALALCARHAQAHGGSGSIEPTSIPPNGGAYALLRILRVPVPLGGGALAALALRHTTEVESDDAPGGSVDVLDLPDGERPIQHRTRAVRRSVGQTDVRASVGHDGGETTVKWRARAPPADDARRTPTPTPTPKRPGWRWTLRRKAADYDDDDEAKRKRKEQQPLTVAIKASQYGGAHAKYGVELACRGIRTELQRRSNCAFAALLKAKRGIGEIKGRAVVDAGKGKCPLKVDINVKRGARRLGVEAAVDGRSWRVEMVPKQGVELALNDGREVSMEVGDWRMAWMGGPSLQLPLGVGHLSVDRRAARYRRYGPKGGFAIQIGREREVSIDALCTLRDDVALRRRLLIRLSSSDGIAIRFGHFY